MEEQTPETTQDPKHPIPEVRLLLKVADLLRWHLKSHGKKSDAAELKRYSLALVDSLPVQFPTGKKPNQEKTELSESKHSANDRTKAELARVQAELFSVRANQSQSWNQLERRLNDAKGVRDVALADMAALTKEVEELRAKLDTTAESRDKALGEIATLRSRLTTAENLESDFQRENQALSERLNSFAPVVQATTTVRSILGLGEGEDLCQVVRFQTELVKNQQQRIEDTEKLLKSAQQDRDTAVRRLIALKRAIQKELTGTQDHGGS